MVCTVATTEPKESFAEYRKLFAGLGVKKIEQLDIRIREQVDGGNPTVVADPDGRVAQTYREIARKTAAKLALRGKDFSARFPKIVIKNN